MAPEPIFRLRAASVQFGDCAALRDITLSVQPGDRVAVIGPSGAGKSSLIGLLNGTVVATDGAVVALGCDYTRASTRAVRDIQRKVGTIHQHFDLVEQLRAVHNVNAGRLGCWPLWKAVLSLVLPRDMDPVRHALARVGIPDKLHARTGDLSGGEKQRVAIARVLVQQPVAVLADEPVASLDPARGKEIINLLHDIAEGSGVTLLASLHDVDMAIDRFERIIGIREGRIMFDTTSDNVATSDLTELYRLSPGTRDSA
jgi:phosphonate transport system ATP-binding protein